MTIPMITAAPETICIFLHGFPNNASMWDAQVEHLQKNATVVCLDNFADSTTPSLDSFMKLIYANVELLKSFYPNSRIFLIGHDLGCISMNEVARELESQHKGSIAGLILLNGVSLTQLAVRMKSFRQHLKSSYVWLLQIPCLPSLAKLCAKAAFKRAKKVPQHTDFNAVRNIDLYREVFWRALRRAVLRRPGMPCTVPTLIVHSHDDRYLEAPTPAELQAAFTNATLAVIPGHHWSPVTNAPLVNNLLTKFIFPLGA